VPIPNYCCQKILLDGRAFRLFILHLIYSGFSISYDELKVTVQVAASFLQLKFVVP